MPTSATLSGWIGGEIEHDFHYCEGTMSTATDIANRIQRGLDFAPASNNALQDIPLLKAGLMRAEWERIISALLAYDSPPYVPSEWISVKVRLPADKTDVLVLDHALGGGPEINMATYLRGLKGYDDQWMFNVKPWQRGPTYHHVTHWMPLPSCDISPSEVTK